MKEGFCETDDQIDLFGEVKTEQEKLEEAYAKCSKEIFSLMQRGY